MKLNEPERKPYVPNLIISRYDADPPKKIVPALCEMRAVSAAENEPMPDVLEVLWKTEGALAAARLDKAILMGGAKDVPVLWLCVRCHHIQRSQYGNANISTPYCLHCGTHNAVFCEV